jgi:hypothetical protein
MQIPSSSVLASWPAANYVDPVTHGPGNIIVIALLLALVTIFLCIRFYTRLVITRGFGVDDVLVLLAFVRRGHPSIVRFLTWRQIPAAAFAALGLLATTKLNWDRHAWDVRPEFVTPGLQVGYVCLSYHSTQGLIVLPIY